MKLHTKIPGILIICGSVLSVIGIVLLIAKDVSIVSIMALPVILIGILMWYHARKVSSSGS